MAYPELELLGRWQRSAALLGPLTAGNFWSPAAASTTEPNMPQGLLNGHEVAEVAFPVVYSPVSAGGAPDGLGRLGLVLDGQDYPWVWFATRLGVLMCPKPTRIRAGKHLTLGTPTWSRAGHPNGLLDATCPKCTTSATVKVYAESQVADDFIVELWGYRYDSTLLAKLMPVYNPQDVVIPDPANDRSYTLHGHPVAADGDWRRRWKELPGGAQQSVQRRASDGKHSCQVFPLVRRARNAQAILTTQAYGFQYQNGTDTPGVADPNDNLYWNLTEDEAILAKRLGVVGPAPSAGAELLAAWIQTPSEKENRRHPKGGIPVSYYHNDIPFGLIAGTTNDFAAVPELPQGPQLLTNEIAYPTVIAQGGSVAPNSTDVAFVGLYVNSGKSSTI